MNKLDFANKLASRSNIPRSKALEITNSVIEIMTETLNQNGRIQFIGFGTFEVKLTPKRLARNPRTNDPVLIPERYRAIFKPSKKLLFKLNGKQR